MAISEGDTGGHLSGAGQRTERGGQEGGEGEEEELHDGKGSE